MGQVCRWTLALHGCIALNCVCIRCERRNRLFPFRGYVGQAPLLVGEVVGLGVLNLSYFAAINIVSTWLSVHQKEQLNTFFALLIF